jgi:anti-anti-sigma factor
MGNFELRTLPNPPVARSAEISLSGTVVTSSLTIIHEALQHAIEAGARILIVELKDVPQMSSAPISALVAASEQVRVLGGKLVLAGMTPKLKVIFDALALGSAFTMARSLEEGRTLAAAHAAIVAKAPRLDDIPILDAVTIGSDARCTITLKHPQVEPKHAEVVRRGTEVVLRDLGSRYGTFVDGKRVKEQAVAIGATITIAGTSWKVNGPTG